MGKPIVDAYETVLIISLNASENTGRLEKHSPSIYEDACKPLITPWKNLFNPDGCGVGRGGGGVGSGVSWVY